jgi:Zn ribbon nucleic-acid-binding protein
MGCVDSEIECPQCAYSEAALSYYYREGRTVISCFRCGFEESKGPVRDANGKETGWKQEATYGAGAMRYENTGGIGSVLCCLHEAQEVAESEVWLWRHIASGKISKKTCYLTRWNEEKKQVESVVGIFFR